jgi:hypothetical protein
MADVNGAEPGDGATGGDQGKPGSKSTPSGDDKEFVPKSQFLAALRSANEKNQALEVQIAEMRGRQSAGVVQVDEPKRYTKAELNAAVEAKQITSEQSDEIWAKQIREDAKREAREEILSVTKAERQQERVETDLNEYKQLAPEIMEEGSEVRKRVQDEFNYLVSLGNPGAANDRRTLQTQLLAIRAALGPLDKLRTAKSARRETETHEETGGGGSGSGQRRGAPKTAWDQLDKRQRDYYDGQISKGMYADRAAVEAELKFSRSANSGGKRARA